MPMQLVSDRVIQGVAGPTHLPKWPTLAQVDLTSIDRFAAGQPWADYERMRMQAPVMWHPEPDGRPGFWAVTRYEDVKRVNGDPVTFSSQVGGINLALAPPGRRHEDLFAASLNAMINLDGLPHRQLRREHMPYFTVGYLRDLRARIAAEVARRLDAMADRDECDFVEAFAGHIPLFTLCEMLGIPESDREPFLRWIHFLELAQQVAAEQAGRADAEMSPELLGFIELFNRNVEEMFAYGRDMLRRRRQKPQEDLLSAIANAKIDGELLPEEYLDGSWLLIVFAGNDTTRNTLSGGLKLLTEHPAQRERLLCDAALLPNAVHEITRVVSPVIHMRRTAACDTQIAGQRIAAGEKVVMWYGAANHDETVFGDSERFDIERANAEKNIAFGHGPHICIGRLAAQIQLEESYRQMLQRFPHIHWTGEIDIAPNNFVHGIRRLGVRLNQKASA